jgi:hypothetical protein
MTTTAEQLTSTISFRLTYEECRVLAERALREDRTLSNLVRKELRSLFAGLTPEGA